MVKILATKTEARARRERMRSLFGVAALALVLEACGAGARPPAAPAASAPGAAPQDATAASEAAATPRAGPTSAGAPPPPAAAAPAAPMTVVETSPQPVATMPSSMTAEVGAEMKRAEHDVATGDCPTACRALGSMERSVVFLCAANTSTDDADRCANGRRHVLSARHRIRTNCGGCPGGPSVEPDAPIPSTR
jgi:hypothetical protein